MSSPAAFLYPSPGALALLRQGTASIPLLATTTGPIADTAITANSVIVCWGVGDANATATSFSPDALIPGASFTISSDVAPTINAKTVGWAILKY